MAKQAKIESVLLIQVGAMGDCVLQLRIAEALKQFLAQANVTWLGRDGWVPVAKRCRYVDCVVGLDAIGAHKLFQPGETTDVRLGQFLQRFDLIVSGATAFDDPAARRLRQAANIATVCYALKPQSDCAGHIVQQCFWQIAHQLADRVGSLAEFLIRRAVSSRMDWRTLLTAQGDDLAEAAAALRRAGWSGAVCHRRIALIQPGSGAAAKCWPIANFSRLAEMLQERGHQPIWLFGPAEVERLHAQIDTFRQRWPVVIDPPLPALIGMLALADGYVGNDAGPTHLAAAIGSPTIAIFGPTEPALWQPLGPEVSVLRSRAYAGHWVDLSAESVLHAVLTALKATA